MTEPVNISTFRQKAGPYFSEVVHRHMPLAIQRGSGDLGLLLGGDEAWALLADRSFSPKVSRGSQGSINMWLSEFSIYGQGSTYAEAKQDLLDEVRVYVSEYLDNSEEYLRAPNRAGHLPHVMKAFLADLRGELEQTIFPAAPSTQPRQASLAGAAS
jgi:Antitoxin of toxin-antitoxin, RelE / RelB, TA system